MVVSPATEIPTPFAQRLVYMEVLSFRQQLEAYAKAQVLVMGHGAAFANIMFMAPVCAAGLAATSLACFDEPDCCQHLLLLLLL